MKTLFLVRHAKSSWDDPSVSDHDRTLNNRGENDAPLMGDLLKNKNILPELILSSTAVRAATTAEIFAEKLGYKSKIKFDSRIYEASTKDLAEVIAEIDNSNSTVILFGHNPGISSFANFLSQKPIVQLSTCSVVGFELNITDWKNIERYCGKLILDEYPKKYK